MEQPKYLIDTNAVIDYLGSKIPNVGMSFMHDIINAIPNISIITKIEVLGFNVPHQHLRTLEDFIHDSNVLNLSNYLVDTCIEIRRKHRTKLPDAIIAATAIVSGLILVSRNTQDFKNIEGLQLINPHEL